MAQVKKVSDINILRDPLFVSAAVRFVDLFKSVERDSAVIGIIRSSLAKEVEEELKKNNLVPLIILSAFSQVLHGDEQQIHQLADLCRASIPEVKSAQELKAGADAKYPVSNDRMRQDMIANYFASLLAEQFINAGRDRDSFLSMIGIPLRLADDAGEQKKLNAALTQRDEAWRKLSPIERYQKDQEIFGSKSTLPLMLADPNILTPQARQAQRELLIQQVIANERIIAGPTEKKPPVRDPRGWLTQVGGSESLDYRSPLRALLTPRENFEVEERRHGLDGALLRGNFEPAVLSDEEKKHRVVVIAESDRKRKEADARLQEAWKAEQQKRAEEKKRNAEEEAKEKKRRVEEALKKGGIFGLFRQVSEPDEEKKKAEAEAKRKADEKKKKDEAKAEPGKTLTKEERAAQEAGDAAIAAVLAAEYAAELERMANNAKLEAEAKAALDAMGDLHLPPAANSLASLSASTSNVYSASTTSASASVASAVPARPPVHTPLPQPPVVPPEEVSIIVKGLAKLNVADRKGSFPESKFQEVVSSKGESALQQIAQRYLELKGIPLAAKADNVKLMMYMMCDTTYGGALFINSNTMVTAIDKQLKLMNAPAQPLGLPHRPLVDDKVVREEAAVGRAIPQAQVAVAKVDAQALRKRIESLVKKASSNKAPFEEELKGCLVDYLKAKYVEKKKPIPADTDILVSSMMEDKESSGEQLYPLLFMVADMDSLLKNSIAAATRSDVIVQPSSGYGHRA